MGYCIRACFSISRFNGFVQMLTGMKVIQYLNAFTWIKFITQIPPIIFCTISEFNQVKFGALTEYTVHRLAEFRF